MFICVKCGKSSKPGEHPHHVVLERRAKAYFVKDKDGKDIPVQVNPIRKRTPESFTEAVREGNVCAECAKKV